jgi:energy-coupling factor transporter transmembrane protein EcfT
MADYGSDDSASASDSSSSSGSSDDRSHGQPHKHLPQHSCSHGCPPVKGRPAMALVVPFGQYVPGSSIVHRLDARMKLLVIAAYVFALFMVSDWPGLLLCALVFAGFYIAAQIPIRLAFRGLKPLIVLLLFTLFANTVSFSAQPIEGVYFSKAEYEAAQQQTAQQEATQRQATEGPQPIVSGGGGINNNGNDANAGNNNGNSSGSNSSDSNAGNNGNNIGSNNPADGAPGSANNGNTGGSPDPQTPDRPSNAPGATDPGDTANADGSASPADSENVDGVRGDQSTAAGSTTQGDAFSIPESIALIGSFGVKPLGALRGLYFVLRIILLVGLTLLLTYTTSVVALTNALVKLMQPLAKLRVPTEDIATMFSIALRFIPVTAAEAEKIVVAQSARGAVFNQGGPIKRVRAWLPVMVPLFVNLFRRADEIACAMETRCYVGRGRTHLRESETAELDYAIGGLSAFALILIGLML